MKASIKQVNKYTLVIDGVTFENVTRGNQWNGMVEFYTDTGELIILHKHETGFRDMFKDIFSGGREIDNAESETFETDVAKISTSLVRTIDQSKKDPDRN